MNLVDVGSAAAMAGEREQVIYHAISMGKLPVAKRNPFRLDPCVVMQWVAERAAKPRMGRPRRVVHNTLSLGLIRHLPREARA